MCFPTPVVVFSICCFWRPNGACCRTACWCYKIPRALVHTGATFCTWTISRKPGFSTFCTLSQWNLPFSSSATPIYNNEIWPRRARIGVTRTNFALVLRIPLRQRRALPEATLPLWFLTILDWRLTSTMLYRSPDIINPMIWSTGGFAARRNTTHYQPHC